MQRVSHALRPTDGPFEVPFSTGYQTYGGLLSVLSNPEDQIADELHDAPFTGLSNSGLLGQFAYDADREYHKVVRDGEDVRYDLHLGVVHPDDRTVFEALMRAFVIEDRTLPLAHGELTVEEVSTERTTPQELLEETSTVAADATGVRMRFRSPTCLERYEGVWEAHPDRVELFRQLADRWNAVVDQPELELAPTPDALGRGLYTVANTDRYDTHSIVVFREEPTDCDAEGDTRQIAGGGGHLNEVQGFTGEWKFMFKDASPATRTAVLTLARFAEFAGVGRHTARGAGSITTELLGCDL